MAVLAATRVGASFFRPFIQSRFASVAVLGARFDKGQPRLGTCLGPEAIRSSGVLNEITSLGHSVNDLGDLSLEDVLPSQSCGPIDSVIADDRVRMRNAEEVGIYNEQLSRRVSEAVRQHQVTVVLGGDHSIALGTVHGHMQASRHQSPLALLWIDAHADINTPLTSASGNFHGKPVAFLVTGLEHLHVDVPALRWCRPQQLQQQQQQHCQLLQPSQLVYVALRDLDPPELEAIRQLGIRAYCMRQVDKLGIHKIMEMSLEYLRADKSSLHVSFDIDALDTLEAPSTGTSVRGGLSLREGVSVMEEVQRCGALRCLDLVEVNPQLGSARDVHVTVQAARHLLLAALGRDRIGVTPSAAGPGS